MPRRGQAPVKKVIPDPVYSSKAVTKLVNSLMRSGKKTVAQKQVYKAFDVVKEKTQKEPIEVFKNALDNIKPNMEVRSRRVGGAAYQVPMPVRGKRKESLALRWLIKAARAKSNSEFHTFGEKLASEIMEAAVGEGAAVKKRTDTEKMAEANRAFAHFRW